MNELLGKKVAIFSENGFEESEPTSPKQALEAAGATVHIISPQPNTVKGWKDWNWFIDMTVDVQLENADRKNYDGLVIPGGVINPDLMRRNDDCVEFAQQFLEQGKVVDAICHGSQLLIETKILDGRKMTSFSSIRTDLENAGVDWVDGEVVADDGLITSRRPENLDAFNAKLIEELLEEKYENAL